MMLAPAFPVFSVTVVCGLRPLPLCDLLPTLGGPAEAA